MQPQQRQLQMLLQKHKLKLGVKRLLKRNKSVLQQNKLKQSKKQKLRLKRKLRLSAKPLLRPNKNVLRQSKQKQHKRQRLKQNKKLRLKLRRRLRLRQKQKLERKQNKIKSLNCLNRMLMNVIKLLPKVLLQQVKKIYFHSQLIPHYKLIRLQRLPSPLTSIITSQ